MSISGSITGGDSLEELVRQLQELEDPDLMPLALDIREAVIEGNREGLLAGLDADGRPFADLKDSTIKRGRGGFGPPLVPRYSASQLIDRFRVKISQSAAGGIRIQVGWPGVEQVRYFKSGTAHMARRNPAGIRPKDREKIRQLVKGFAKKLVAKF